MWQYLYYLITICLFGASWLFPVAQGFQFNISTLEDDRIYDLIELNDGSFLAIGSRGDYWGPSNSSHRGILYEISASGDTIGHCYTKQDTATVFYKIIEDSTLGLVILGSVAVAPNYQEQFMFGVIDEQFNLNILECFKIPGYNNIHSIDYLTSDIHYIVIGIHKDQGTANHFNLSKFSLTGDSIFSQTIDNLGNAAFIHDFEFSNNQQKLWLFGNGINGTPRASRIILDKDFNILGSQLIPEFISYPHLNAKWINDNELIFGGKYVHIGSSPQDDDIGFCITDSSFSNLDVHCWGSPDTLDYPAWETSIDFIHPDSIFIAGTHNTVIDFFPIEQSWIMIGQFDQSLMLRNELFYGGDAYYNVMDLLATKDGGCIIAALRYDWLSQNNEYDSYIIKIRKEDVITNIWTNISEDIAKVAPFPNPGNSYFNVISESKNSVLSLHDLNGRAVARLPLSKGSSRVNTSFLQSGVYIYKITSYDDEIICGKWIKK